MKDFVIKVCGITRRQDAEAAVAAGANALGFVFYPQSPRYVRPEMAASIGEGLDAVKVGIFVDGGSDLMELIAKNALLDVAQIYGAKHTMERDPLRPDYPRNVRVWRAHRVDKKYHNGHWKIGLANLSEGAEAVILDGQKNGVSFDWSMARDSTRKVIVAGGLDASNVAEAIRIARPWGVDASSKLETAPGIKDHEKMRAYVKAAKEAYAHI